MIKQARKLQATLVRNCDLLTGVVDRPTQLIHIGISICWVGGGDPCGAADFCFSGVYCHKKQAWSDFFSKYPCRVHKDCQHTSTKDIAGQSAMTGVKCRATSVAKNTPINRHISTQRRNAALSPNLEGIILIRMPFRDQKTVSFVKYRFLEKQNVAF